MKTHYYTCLLSFVLFQSHTLAANCDNGSFQEQVKVYSQKESPQQSFGLERLAKVVSLKSENSPDQADIVVISSPELSATFNLSTEYSAVMAEGFSIRKISQERIAVLSRDQTGAMYGLLDIAEQIQLGRTVRTLEEKAVNPAVGFRGIKFNLPWNSYRRDESLQLHEKTLRDPNYWKSFLDMMAENRFNALTLWNLHPFTYMIRAKNFPDACPYSTLMTNSRNGSTSGILSSRWLPSAE